MASKQNGPETRNGGESRIEAEYITTRLLNAPRDLVYRAFTEPRHLARWWGPEGFENPRCELDVRAGGAIYLDMRGPDGTLYPMSGQFKQVSRPQRLVFTTAALDDQGNPIFENLNTVMFEDIDGETEITLYTRVIESTAQAVSYIERMDEGWTQSLDRLESHLATMR